MTTYSATAKAGTAGTAVALIQHGKVGIWWITWQWTVETIPVRTGARCTVRRNGRYVTSTIVGSGSSAQGPPAIMLEANDNLEFSWVGLTSGDQAIASLYYEETQAGSHGSQFGLV